MHIKPNLQRGTNDTINFMNQNLSEEDIIISNIKHLYWTVLEYYFPNNTIHNSETFDYINNENIIWLFEDDENEINKENITDLGYNIQKVYVGSIDTMYDFSIYKLTK